MVTHIGVRNNGIPTYLWVLFCGNTDLPPLFPQTNRGDAMRHFSPDNICLAVHLTLIPPNSSVIQYLSYSVTELFYLVISILLTYSSITVSLHIWVKLISKRRCGNSKMAGISLSVVHSYQHHIRIVKQSKIHEMSNQGWQKILKL